MDNELRIERLFKASPERVFALWSDPQQIMQWWHPKDFKTTYFTMDFRKGGHYRYCMRSPDDKEHWAHGTYVEIEPPLRLAFTFKWERAEATVETETLISVTFEAVGDNTLMTFRQSPFASRTTRNEHAEGWSELLDSFVAHFGLSSS